MLTKKSMLLASLVLFLACSIGGAANLAGGLCRNVECKFFRTHHIGDTACVTLCKNVRCIHFKTYHINETPCEFDRR
jgi:hypothetical protein